MHRNPGASSSFENWRTVYMPKQLNFDVMRQQNCALRYIAYIWVSIHRPRGQFSVCKRAFHFNVVDACITLTKIALFSLFTVDVCLAPRRLLTKLQTILYKAVYAAAKGPKRQRIALITLLQMGFKPYTFRASNHHAIPKIASGCANLASPNHATTQRLEGCKQPNDESFNLLLAWKFCSPINLWECNAFFQNFGWALTQELSITLFDIANCTQIVDS